MEQRFKILDLIRQDGQIVLVKLDGEREDNFYTVVISYPQPSVFQPIRLDGRNFSSLIDKVVDEYQKRHSKE